MTAPCMLGLKCPCHRITTDGEGICTHPYIRTPDGWFDCDKRRLAPQMSSSVALPTADTMDATECPLMEPGSRLENILMEVKQ